MKEDCLQSHHKILNGEQEINVGMEVLSTQANEARERERKKERERER